MAQVVMLIHEENGAFGASFPDFPGATTVADSLDTLIPKAAEMLAFHVSGMVEDGEPIPAVRTPGRLHEDPEFREEVARPGAMLWLLEVDLPGKSVRVNITLEEGILKRIDRAARAAGETRSGFLAAAAKERLRASAQA